MIKCSITLYAIYRALYIQSIVRSSLGTNKLSLPATAGAIFHRCIDVYRGPVKLTIFNYSIHDPSLFPRTDSSSHSPPAARESREEAHERGHRSGRRIMYIIRAAAAVFRAKKKEKKQQKTQDIRTKTRNCRSTDVTRCQSRLVSFDGRRWETGAE